MLPTLYIVATPIGHLSDISFRAVDILKSVDCIAAEDTRHSARLLAHYQIDTPMISYHEFGGDGQVNQVLKRLNEGQSIALISDAGTPLISDPGFRLVNCANEQGIKVVPIPGASALTAALSVAGLPTDQFTFAGFLPAKQKARCDVLSAFAASEKTTVFYEAPHRLLVCLEDMLQIFGAQRKLCLVRELTKTFETIALKPLDEMLEWVALDENQQKGELVLVLEGQREKVAQQLDEQSAALAETLLEHLPPKPVSKIVAEHYKVNKKDVYNYLLSLKS